MDDPELSRFRSLYCRAVRKPFKCIRRIPAQTYHDRFAEEAGQRTEHKCFRSVRQSIFLHCRFAAVKRDISDLFAVPEDSERLASLTAERRDEVFQTSDDIIRHLCVNPLIFRHISRTHRNKLNIICRSRLYGALILDSHGIISESRVPIDLAVKISDVPAGIAFFIDLFQQPRHDAASANIFMHGDVAVADQFDMDSSDNIIHRIHSRRSDQTVAFKGS